MRRLILFACFIFLFFNLFSQVNLKILREKQYELRNKNCDEIFKLSEKFIEKKDSFYYYWFKGKSNFCSSNYLKAYNCFSNSLQFIPLKNKVLRAEIELELAISLSILNQKGDALNSFLKVQKVCNSSRDKILKIKFHLAYGEYLRKFAEFNKAENELRKGLNYLIKDKFFLTHYFNRIAAIKTEKSEKDSSLIYSKKALKLAYELNNYNLIATSENEIAFIFRHTNKWKEALEKYQIASSYWKNAGMNLYALDARASIVTVMDDTKYNYRNQKRILLECLKEATENKWYQSVIIITPHLMNIYTALNKKDSIDYYHICLLNAEISLLNIVNKTNTSFIQMKYDQAKNKNIILSQSQKIKTEHKQVLNFIILSVSITLILLLVSYILILQIKKKKQIRIEKLEEEKRNKNLQILLSEKTALVQEVHHRVKNNLQFMDAMIQMQADLSDDEKSMEALSEISRRLNAMALVHEMIYSKNQAEKIILEFYLKELIEMSKSILGKSLIDIKFELQCENLELNINRTMSVGMIVSELINNSFKYAFKQNDNPKINIYISKVKDKEIKIIYLDNGPGYDSSKNKVGLGLNLIDIFSRQLKGKYLIESTNKFMYELNFPDEN